MKKIEQIQESIANLKLYNNEVLRYHCFVDDKDFYTNESGDAMVWAMDKFWEGYRDIRVYAEIINKDGTLEEEHYIWGIGGMPC